VTSSELIRPASLAVLLVAGGACLRVPGLADPPLDFHATRQYRSAIIARGYSLDLLGGLEPAMRQVAESAAKAQPAIEPLVMERLASWVYHAIGHEDLAWARALAVGAWSLGGFAIFWLAIQVVTAPAAVAAVAVWTFLPFGIRASQSFQPDPLMTALMVLALASAVGFRRRPAAAWGVLFGGALAAALLVKAVSVFFLGPALMALFLLGEGSIRAKAVTAAVAGVAVVPAAWYYARLPLGTDYGPFFQLLREPSFWRDWAVILDRVVSWPLMIAGLAGALAATGELRRLLAALFAGYFVFGIVFTHHIHTHDYYSLPLIPVVALGVGALVDRIARTPPTWSRGAAAAIVAVPCVTWGVLMVVDSRRSEQPAALRAEAARYERIGEIVGHSTRVLALDGAYGFPLDYHGYLNTTNWPLSGDVAMMALTGGSVGAAEARLRSSGAEFFVSTIQPEFDAQPDLKEMLERQHPLLERDGTPERWAFVVYDLRRGILSATPQNLSMFTRVADSPAPEQTVSLYAPATSRWAVQVPADGSVRVEPAEGTGPANLRVTIAVPTSEVDRTTKVGITSIADGSTSFDVRIRSVAGPDKPPFGFVDAPPDPVTLGQEPVLFQGWGLDDTSMKRVWAGYVDASGQIVALGDARRDGPRPDLTKAFPTAHDLFKAAWSFVLDPETVRDAGRPLQLRFFAEDGSGQRAEIGRRTVK